MPLVIFGSVQGVQGIEGKAHYGVIGFREFVLADRLQGDGASNRHTLRQKDGGKKTKDKFIFLPPSFCLVASLFR